MCAGDEDEGRVREVGQSGNEHLEMLLLNEVVDDSDPDLDELQNEHLLQTA